jgi:penicillin-binding protein 1A
MSSDPLDPPKTQREPGQEPEAESERERRLRLLKKWAKIAGIVLAAALALGMLTIWLVVRHYESKLPSVEQLKHGYDPPQVTRVLARDGTLLASIYTERRTVIPFADLPAHVKLAFLAAEDASFYEHEGLDYIGMLRALWANLRAGRSRQGASTITQQVIKNVLLDPERTYERKIKETILARRLEQTLSKDEIFSLYLNAIYLGHGRYGIEEASRYYFRKKARELDLAEASLLAGIIASPEKYSPRHDAKKALTRRRYVLGQMLEKGFVTRELYDGAIDAPLYLEPASEGESDLIPEVVGHVKKLLDELAGERSKKGGYTVHTSIDPALQASARRAVRENLDAYAKRHDLLPPFTVPSRKAWPPPPVGALKPFKAYTAKVVALDDANGSIELEIAGQRCRVLLAAEERYNPAKLGPSEFTRVGAALRASFSEAPGAAPVACKLELGPESALLAIDPRSREVLALIGSYSALPGGLDRATRSKRQPGSSFKPVLYSYALHSRRFTPATVLDLPEKLAPGVKKDPQAPAAKRLLPLRLAVAQSDNDAAARVLQEVGAPNVVSWARALGIESELAPTPSLALGAYEVTPLELVAAFAALAAGGEYDSPKLVTKILAPDGTELALPQRPPKRRVMTPEEAYLTTSLLRSVVELGTGKRAKTLGRPVAGKTGTTNQAKDAWFVGYSTEIVSGVWVGFDDPQPLGWGESGAVSALPAWIAFMKAAHDKHPSTDFPRPASIVLANVDPATGLLAREGEDGVEEEFLDGTVPEAVAPEDAGAPELGAADASDDEQLASSQPTGSLPEVDAGAAPAPAEADAGSEPPPPPF